MQKIEYIFTVENGNLTIQLQGQPGSGCVERVQEVLNYIGGTVTKEEHTDEYYQPPAPDPVFQHDIGG
jgi:hypothetical protein